MLIGNYCAVLFSLEEGLCVHVYMCDRERERERERDKAGVSLLTACLYSPCPIFKLLFFISLYITLL